MIDMKPLPIFLVVIVLLAGCSTISQKAAEHEAQDLIAAVDSGELDTAIDMSARPFLFEGEILLSEALVSDLWEGLSSLDFSQAELSGYTVVDSDSARFFEDSWEVRTWLENYTDETTAMVIFDWNNSQLVLIVDRSVGATQRIMGFGELH